MHPKLDILLKQQLMKGGRPRAHLVPGISSTVYVRRWDGAERLALWKWAAEANLPERLGPDEKAEVFVRTVCNPSGVLLFTAEDKQAVLDQIEATVLDAIVDEAMRVNGLLLRVFKGDTGGTTVDIEPVTTDEPKFQLILWSGEPTA